MMQPSWCIWWYDYDLVVKSFDIRKMTPNGHYLRSPNGCPSQSAWQAFGLSGYLYIYIHIIYDICIYTYWIYICIQIYVYIYMYTYIYNSMISKKMSLETWELEFVNIFQISSDGRMRPAVSTFVNITLQLGNWWTTLTTCGIYHDKHIVCGRLWVCRENPRVVRHSVPWFIIMFPIERPAISIHPFWWLTSSLFSMSSSTFVAPDSFFPRPSG